MKTKFAFINSLLMLTVLFAMFLQSIHSIEHLHQLFEEKECPHKYTGNTEISHQHHPLDHCFVCEFTFGSYVNSEGDGFKIISPENTTQYASFYSKEISILFKGSLFSLRGPPLA